MVISSLARTLCDQGKLEEAAAMQREVLEKRRQILGEEHPDTLMATNKLAIILSTQDQLEAVATRNAFITPQKRRKRFRSMVMKWIAL